MPGKTGQSRPPKKKTKVSTPGSYKTADDGSSKKKKKRSSVGRPVSKAKRQTRGPLKLRATYTEMDMLEAMHLVVEKKYSIKKAAKTLTDVKKHVVPRTTLNDRLLKDDPPALPAFGRPVELPKPVEKAIVDCLKMCGEFQYPMRKTDLQNLVQSYCVQNSIKTRWRDERPAREWCKLFLKRWSKEVKLRRPRNIKRSRSKVSPAIVKEFFEHLTPNIQGIPPTHIVNYDETNLQDDPGAELAFFGGGTKYCEQSRNSSKTAVSVMFACTASGHMLPPMTVYKSAVGSCYGMWCEGGPEGANYAATKSGWFNMEMFNLWFKTVLLEFFKTLPKEDTKLLIGMCRHRYIKGNLTLLSISFF